MVRVIRDQLREEIVFIISLVLAIIAVAFRPLNFEVIDTHVLIILFNLMLLALAFEKYGLLDSIAVHVLRRSQNERIIGFLMILATAFLSMFITNDVALITVVPITLSMARMASLNPMRLVVLETVAANIGSSFTPFGNPQNLFLYSRYGIGTIDFFKITFLFTLLGLIFLLIVNLFTPKHIIHTECLRATVHSKKRLMLMSFMFFLMIAAILRFIPLIPVSMIIWVSFILLERELYFKVDYFLLGTFVCFFIVVDFISHVQWLSDMTSSFATSKYAVLLLSGLISQLISNVPAAIFMSAFTLEYKSILLGVSIGGMGTMIAYLISFKFYIKEYPAMPYRKLFYKINFIGFVIFLGLYSFII